MSKRTTAARIAGVLASGIAVSFLAVAPAHAGTASVSRTVWLGKFPSVYNDPASVSRDIYLAANTYTWQVSATRDSTGSIHGYASRSIYLAAGTYHWVCTISVPVEYDYKNSCSLSSGNGATAYLNSVNYEVPASENYTINGYLIGQ
ncbi:hypothetical protein [Streptomyces sp. NPDC004284]|uniref:hypothetical protein n=1 Tax=Streptomyces sp. NPDC004284 TaxID=3364695 RepID=UPI0036C5479D